MKNESTPKASKNAGEKSPRKGGANLVLLYSIIGILSVVIIVGMVFIIQQNKRETVRIESFSPRDEVQQTTNFTITFSRPIIADSVVNNWLPDALISFQPTIPGRWQWIGSDKIRFYPDVMLLPSTNYSAQISAGLLVQYGFILRGEKTFTFFTPKFKVNSSSLVFEFIPESQQQVKLLASVEFNYPVEPTDVLKNGMLRYKDGRNISFFVKTTSAQKIIELESDPIKETEDEKDIEFVLSRDLRPIGANLGLSEDYTAPIILPRQQDLKVEHVSPIRESAQQGSIKIQFNMPVNPKTAGQFITVEPRLSYQLTASHHYLHIKGQFEMDTAYTVTLRQGLRAVDGSSLTRDFTSSVSFLKEDIPPQIDFVGDGFYLTRSGFLNLGMATINMDEVTVEIDKIYANNINFLLNQNDLAENSSYYWYDIHQMGTRIAEYDVPIEKLVNEEVVTPINIEKYIRNEHRGIFNIAAFHKEQRWIRASKWVIATDMGMVAKKAGGDLWVWVNSLVSLAPVANADIQLLSQNNQLIATKKTDVNGLCMFEGVLAGSEEFPPYLLVATNGDDLSFLELTRRQIATTDFDVDGALYLQHGFEAFLYNERGVYRPGETARLAAMVRCENASVPVPFPVILRVLGPDERIHEEQRATLNEQGAAEFAVAFPEYVKTGKYTALLLVGESDEIGRTSFNVEEFIPDRMKVSLATDRDEYRAGAEMTVDVQGMTLFGPPASGRLVQADIVIEPFEFSPAKWKSYTFGCDEVIFNRFKQDFGEEFLDEDGTLSYIYSISSELKAPSSLRGIVSATVLEPGGRGVSGYKGVIIHPYESYVGLRQAKEGYAEPHRPTEIQFIAVDTQGNPAPGRDIEVACYRVYWQSILKRVDRLGTYRYVSEKVEDLVQKLEVTSASEPGVFAVTPEDYGSYRVVATDVRSGAVSSITFYASGWGYSPWALDNPDRIELDLDKERYMPGETATVQVRAPFAGKLLLTVEREKVLFSQVHTMTENTAAIKVPIKATFKPNVYISAHLIRSTESLERDTPVRAFGATPLFLDNSDNQLSLELKAPDEMRPLGKLSIELKVKNKTTKTPFVTIAAVDEGICQLTEFDTPDPHAFFFSKKRLSVETVDVYGVVLPEIESGKSSPSGDVEAQRKRSITPVSVTRTRPVAYWSGLLKTDRSGRARVEFDIPQFNGTIRIMAAACADNNFGNFEKKVLVREPIVLTPTFPRFVASRDQFVIPVSIFNGTGSAGTFDATLNVKGPARLIQSEVQRATIAAGAEGQVFFEVQADESMGALEFRLSVQGNGKQTSMATEIPLRPPVPFITLSGQGSVKQGAPASFHFPSEWLPGTTDFSISVSSFPAVQFAGSLGYLLHYPHGCVEQTTSQVFPLLYFSDLARVVEPALFKQNSAEYFIEEGISKLETMQQPSGAFSYWPEGEYINNWSSIYAAHFLVEARRLGYEISNRVYNKMIDALENFTRDYRSDDRYGYETAVYACYVLALANQPSKSTMLYVKNSSHDKLSAYSRYQLAGAFALSGDMQTARELLPRTVAIFQSDRTRETGQNFNSPIRAQAIMLDILAEVDPTHPSVPALIESISGAASENGRWGTTQENAFAFLALGKILKKQEKGNYTGNITIDGQTLSAITQDSRNFSAKDWAGKTVRIDIQGQGTCYYSWRADGIPSTLRIDEYDHDLMVRRVYLNEQGIPISGASFEQGDMVIAKITVKALTESLENVAIVDMLPAGLEIENPRLQSRKGIQWIDQNEPIPTYMDIRDDRMIMYGNFPLGRETTFYYGLRAVAEGSFILPPIRAEAMYAPMKASVASSGNIVVRKP
ncbi:MAG: MG2 domain-containing protein [Candidatus Zhuqueibacterota bacterium]